ncbi:unnamed protein product, partial [Didymodactylos carnosus]
EALFESNTFSVVLADYITQSTSSMNFDAATSLVKRKKVDESFVPMRDDQTLEVYAIKPAIEQWSDDSPDEASGEDEILEGDDTFQPIPTSQTENTKKIPVTQAIEDSETDTDEELFPEKKTIRKGQDIPKDNEHDYAINRTTSSRILTSEAISNLLGIDVADKFSKSVPEYKKLKLSSTHLETIKERYIIKQQEKQAKEQGGDKSDSKKRDFTVPEIVIQYVKTINPYCSLQTHSNKFTVATKRNSAGHLLRTIGYCGMKNPDCPFRFTVDIHMNGDVFINTNGALIHEGQFKARHIRKPERQALKEAFEQGANPILVFHKRLAQIPRNILKAGNLDGAGKSVTVYQKIAAFNESASFSNCVNRLFDLKAKYMQQLMPHGPVPGIIQRISSDPLAVICLTSSGLTLWNIQATDETAEFTWDATGNVVQCLDLKKKILYYELTMASPIKRGTPIPLTFLLSESQDAVTIKLWLETFKQLYLKQYNSTDSFPTPKIIINDRYGTNDDIQKTIPHACTAHIMKDWKILCHKSKLKKEEVKSIMLYCSVVLNSNTYEELKKNYQLFCVYFIHPEDTPQHRAAKEKLNAAVRNLGKMNEDDVDNVIAYHEKYLQLNVVDEYDIDDIDKEEIDDDIKKMNQTVQTWFSEEQMLNEFDSNVKTDMHQIYGSVWKQLTSVASQNSNNKSSDTHVFTKSRKRIKDEESDQKAHETNLNPHGRFILRFNKLYMPTVHLWSNILLGDLDRYRTIDNVTAAGTLRQEIAKIQRTTGTSEKRMSIVKNVELNKKALKRLDLVVGLLCDDTIAIQKQAGLQLAGPTRSRRLKELTERWSKKKIGHYQQYAKSMENLIKMKMPEVMFYCDTKTVAVWQNKDKIYGLENSVLRATITMKVLQRNMIYIDPTIILPDHLDDLCTLLGVK